MLNESTKENLRRKSAYVDKVQLHDGKVLFSWVDFSLTELCNRLCVFCPRIDKTFYPNQNLHMSLDLVRKIATELCELKYEGVVVLCGFGEPLLHPKIVEVVSALKLNGSSNARWRVEVVTNGDKLTPGMIRKLRQAGIDFFVVSMYDGPEQIEKFRAQFSEVGLVEHEDYILRDRWHSEEDGFGLKLTNRAGTVNVGKQDPVDVHQKCTYTTYMMQIDWQGDVTLCPQDWSKKVKFGNIYAQTLLEVWHSPALHKRRMKLIDGRREDAPCSSCNADGTLHGFNHAPIWKGEIT